MKVGLAGSRSETKVVGGCTPRSDNAVLEDVAMAVAVAEVTADDVAEVDPDGEGNGVDEMVRVIEASVDDEESGLDELRSVIGLGSGVETAEVEAMELANFEKQNSLGQRVQRG